MKQLKIYKESGEFVIERVNEFNHATKRKFITENGFKEGLDAYRPVLGEYEIEASDEVWGLVINHLNSTGIYTKIEVNVNESTLNTLQEISKLKNCSLEAAANIVLERYARRAKREIDSADKLVNKLKNNNAD